MVSEDDVDSVAQATPPSTTAGTTAGEELTELRSRPNFLLGPTSASSHPQAMPQHSKFWWQKTGEKRCEMNEKLSKPGSSSGLAWPYKYCGVEGWNQPEGLHRAPSNSKAQSHICAFGVCGCGCGAKTKEQDDMSQLQQQRQQRRNKFVDTADLEAFEGLEEGPSSAFVSWWSRPHQETPRKPVHSLKESQRPLKTPTTAQGGLPSSASVSWWSQPHQRTPRKPVHSLKESQRPLKTPTTAQGDLPSSASVSWWSQPHQGTPRKPVHSLKESQRPLKTPAPVQGDLPPSPAPIVIGTSRPSMSATVSEHDTDSVAQVTPPSTTAGITVEEELTELLSRPNFLLESAKRRRLREFEEQATPHEQHLELEAEPNPEEAERETLVAQMISVNMLNKRARSRLRELEDLEAARKARVSAPQQSPSVARSAVTNTTPDKPVAKPPDLSLPALQPTEQQAVTTVLSLLTAQIHTLEAQNKTLTSDLAEAKGAIAKFETYHDSLVAHAIMEAKNKAILRAQHDSLARIVDEQKDTISEMQYNHEAAISQLESNHRMNIAQLETDKEKLRLRLQEEDETRGEMIAQGICDRLPTVALDDLDTAECADGDEKPVALPKGAVSETLKKLLSELAAARERAREFEQRVLSLEKSRRIGEEAKQVDQSTSWWAQQVTRTH